jgi:hypothetical protein
MTLTHRTQQENEVNLRCSSKIADLQHLTTLKISQIAELLGVRYETINRAANGHTGSEQLFCGLKMLLENYQMRQRLDAIENAHRTLNALALNDASGSLPPSLDKVEAIALVGPSVKYKIQAPQDKLSRRKNKASRP